MFKSFQLKSAYLLTDYLKNEYCIIYLKKLIFFFYYLMSWINVALTYWSFILFYSAQREFTAKFFLALQMLRVEPIRPDSWPYLCHA